MTVFIGRQPILDGHRRRRGYELLFRSGNVGGAVFDDPDAATRTVVERAMLEWGLANLVGEGTAFVNVTADFLHSGLFSVLPADRVVLELLESVEFDADTVGAVREAARLGYRFALDDLISMSVVGLDQVLPFVDIVKVEVLSLSEAQTRRLVADLRASAPRARLLAEKVETLDDFRFCGELGFDLFQGYFFAKPEVMERRARPIGHQAALVLLTAVQDPTITIERLADLANADPTLAYRLLKLANASSTGLASTTDSVHQAIVLLGIGHVCQLATLLTMASNSMDNRELITLAVTRAHMARALLADRPEANAAFTAGLLSVIDVVFRAPMAELVADLPVSPDVRDALLIGAGPIGDVLRLIRAHEEADVATLRQYASFSADTIREAFSSSAARAAELDHQLDLLTSTSRARA